MNFASDLNSDLTNINALPANQFYYWFSGVSVDVWGARYKKDMAYSNVNSIYSTLNSIPSYLAAYFLPTFTGSDAMKVYARQKVDALGPCGRESWEFDTVMTYDQRKAAAGVPSANNVTEVISNSLSLLYSKIHWYSITVFLFCYYLNIKVY